MVTQKHWLGISFGVSALALAGTLYFGPSGQPVSAATITTPLEITAAPVFWVPEKPDEAEAGQLTFVGGLELISDNSAFGGLSGLIVGNEGDALIAITDQGNWLTADLVWQDGKPAALGNALIAPIRDEKGAPLDGKAENDAESLTVAHGGDPRTSPALVGFERHARILSFDLPSLGLDAPAQRVADFGVFKDLVNNSGLEAITLLPDGSLLALSEETLDDEGYIVGARLTQTEAIPVRLKQHRPYALTDIAQLPNGDLITLERRYSTFGGVGMLLRRIPASMLEGTEPLDGDILLEANSSRSIDNMEGLDIRTGPEGQTLLYLVSDDNFNPLQRTLLLVFELQNFELQNFELQD
ncbi:MAG: esterase-like activity of phytase family protein [Parvibaculum sp.]